MNRCAIPLVSALCIGAMIATAFPLPVAAEPPIKKKTSGGTALKPMFGQTVMDKPRREKRTGVKVRQKAKGEQKGGWGGWTGWSEFYRSF
jgi:hypothetical protein